MPRTKLRKKIRWTLVAASCCIVWLAQPSPHVAAQQLSIRHYDVSDGLAHSHVTAMHQDASGYLWLATWEGLSRFDGYHFTNYTQRDGLGDPIVNDIAEDRRGRLWVATNGGGVARLNDDETATADSRRQKFISFRISDLPRANRVNALLFDSQNNIWCATDGGLFRGNEQAGRLSFQLVIPYEGEIGMAALADHQGRLWFGIDRQLIEIAGEQIIKYGPEDEVSSHPVTSIIEDRQGHLIVANQFAIFELKESGESSPGKWQRLPIELKSNQGINVLQSDRTGALWVGTWNGLVKYAIDDKQAVYTNAQGLSDNNISSLVEDRDGNLWIGTVGGGVCKLSSELIVSFTRAEGLPNQDVRKIIEDRAGNIYASIDNGGLVKLVEGKAEPVPGSQTPPFANLNERIVQDPRGVWWIGTDAGLFSFAGPSLQLAHGHKFTAREGLSEVAMGGLYIDASGRFWVSPENQGLYDFEPSQVRGKSFQQIVPPSTTTLFRGAQKAISDPSGTLWLGGHEWLGRLLHNEPVMLSPGDGLPETRPRSFFVDSRGWLWIGLRYRGVSVTKNPGDAVPLFTNYSTSNGMASDTVWAIAEDQFGRMYFGTGKGLDRLDPGTGRIDHFNTDDGLASDIVNYCTIDHAGNIWVGTTLGASKFNPFAERVSNSSAPIYLTRVQVAGEDLRLPETGTKQLSALDLAAGRNNLTLDYVALSFQGENELRYQYKLEGVDQDWSAPTEARSINYARLAPGSYQFVVRAINREGVMSPEPASFQFRILPPLWQRWWFIALAALAIGLIMYALYRQRLARLIEFERVRTRIATDLHDDIGANLSLIAMLSEVSRGQMHDADSRLKEWLTTIAVTSRDTVDSMSDIVWAVNPKRDHLRDLTRRMRRFADDVFAARNIDFQFHAPELDRDIRLGADVRREMFLIFKETVNNAVRHSECSAAAVNLNLTGGALVLEVTDNGKGLPAAAGTDGTGLDSMRGRAERLGGSLHVESGNGTRITLTVPLT